MAERIQSALAKARARRAALETSDIAQTPLADRCQAAWEALPEVHFTAGHLARKHIFTQDGAEAAAPFDLLRTKLMRELRSRGWRRVAITAPDPGTGTSTVAANLAFSLARHSDLRTVLVEADLRRPALATLLGIKSRPQFSDLLDGSAVLPEHLLRYGPNLCLALNTEPVKAAAELLQRPAVPDILSRLEDLLQPSVVLFDLPPMRQRDDTLAFLDKVDCALLVVAADSSKLPDVDVCARELARHTNALGVVLNKLRHAGNAPSAGHGG